MITTTMPAINVTNLGQRQVYMSYNDLALAMKTGIQTVVICHNTGNMVTGRILAIQAEGGRDCWIVSVHRARPGTCGETVQVFVKAR